MILPRRTLLKVISLAAASGVFGGGRLAAAQTAGPAADFGTVLGEAEALSRRPFEEPSVEDPNHYNDLTYDQYRDIRLHRDRGLWAGQGLNFQVALLHPGFGFQIGRATCRERG